MTLRVVLAEDNKVYREGVRAVIEFGGEFEVVGSVDRADALLECVDELEPDAVITDIRMPPTHHMEGIEAAHEIRRRHPSIGILVLSQHADDSYAFELLKDGTAGFGYLLKERIGDDDGAITRALKEVIAGRSVIDPEVVDGLVSRQAAARSSPLHRLTHRERDVLGLMAQGKTNDAIAESLASAPRDGREAHQLDLPRPRPRRGEAGEQARHGGPAVPAPRLMIGVLGPIVADADGPPIELPGASQRRLRRDPRDARPDSVRAERLADLLDVSASGLRTAMHTSATDATATTPSCPRRAAIGSPRTSTPTVPSCGHARIVPASAVLACRSSPMRCGSGAGRHSTSSPTRSGRRARRPG